MKMGHTFGLVVATIVAGDVALSTGASDLADRHLKEGVHVLEILNVGPSVANVLTLYGGDDNCDCLGMEDDVTCREASTTDELACYETHSICEGAVEGQTNIDLCVDYKLNEQQVYDCNDVEGCQSVKSRQCSSTASCTDTAGGDY